MFSNESKFGKIALPFVSGLSSGVLSSMVTYPLYNLVTQIQCGQFESFGEAVKKVTLNDLYVGLKLGTLASGLKQGIYYFWYLLFRRAANRLCCKYGLSMGAAFDLLVGLIAGAATVFLLTPITVVLHRLQAYKKVYKNKISSETKNEKMNSEVEAKMNKDIISKNINGYDNMRKDSLPMKEGEKRPPTASKVLFDLLQEEGLSGLFRGLGSNLFLTINPAIQYATVEQMKKYVPNGSHALFGASSKLLSTLLTYPFSTISIQHQVHSQEQLATGQMGKFSSLFRGCDAKLVQTIISNALLFSFRKVFNKMFNIKD